MARPTTTKWPPAPGERYVGKWPPKWRTPARRPKPSKRRSTGHDYERAMIQKHGSLEAWQAARWGDA
jgi:hypothetical protein